MFAIKRQGWDDEQFRAFLARLDPAPEQAGAAYGRLHRKLQIFFEGRPGSAVHAAELADTTIDRAIRKLSEDPALVPHDLPAYIVGIARFIYLEFCKRPRAAVLDFDPADPASVSEEETEADLRLRCLRHCLTHLSTEDYQLVVAYHAAQKSEKISWRRQAAADMNKSGVALRVRVFRIRRGLELCIGRCLKSSANVTVPRSMPGHHGGDRA